MKLSLKKILIILTIVLILIAGIFSWFIFQKRKFPPPKPFHKQEEVGERILSLMAKISKIDVDKNRLIVKPLNEEKEIKVILSEDTEIIKLGFPFNLFSPSEKEFTLTKTKIKISQLKEGDTIFIKTSKSITDKTEFNNVDFIEVLP
jgi:uncharacterized protein YxeA